VRQVDYIVQLSRERCIVTGRSPKDEGRQHDQEFEGVVAPMIGAEE
jgi:hypothetical protein